MRTTGIVLAALALTALGACSGNETDPPEAVAPAGAERMESSVPAYESTTEILDKIRAEVVPCKTDAPPAATVYSHRAEGCWYKAEDDVEEYMTAATYISEIQQDNMLSEVNGPLDPDPGHSYASGPGWTVKTDAHFAPLIADALGGIVVE